MRYEGRVFRPPSEAYSLIVQVTVGCSYNKCNFCDMYKEKQFHLRKLDDVLDDFRLARRAYRHIERIFLADGDALIRKTDDLMTILSFIRETIPECNRVTCYGSPVSIERKSAEDLKKLHDAGMDMVYMGLESGSDEVLKLMNKGNTADELVAAGIKVRESGMKLSVTAISGLGGKALYKEHALGTASAMSRMNPEYMALLTLLVEADTPLESWVRDGSFTLLTPKEVLDETKLFLENVDSEGSIFRMNHASNYLQLKGTLNQDRERMIKDVERGIAGIAHLKPEMYRAF